MFHKRMKSNGLMFDKFTPEYVAKLERATINLTENPDLLKFLIELDAFISSQLDEIMQELNDYESIEASIETDFGNCDPTVKSYMRKEMTIYNEVEAHEVGMRAFLGISSEL